MTTTPDERDMPDFPNPDTEPKDPEEGPVTMPKPEK